MSKYYIGVDGGGTKTQYALFDDRKNMLSNQNLYRLGFIYRGSHPARSKPLPYKLIQSELISRE